MDMAIKCDIFYVNEMFVHPRYQRKGRGSMALDPLEEELKKTGAYQKITLP